MDKLRQLGQFIASTPDMVYGVEDIGKLKEQNSAKKEVITESGK